MYAVIKTGGKQYKVSPGDVIEVEHLKVKGDAEVSLTPLLVVTDQRETVAEKDRLSEFPVTAKVLGETKGDKVTVFKYRPKSGYASKNGHRQLYSLIQITAIGGTKASELKTAEDVQPESTGPQKPAPVEKAEPEPEPETDSGSSGPIAEPSATETTSGASPTETTSGASPTETTSGASATETTSGASATETTSGASATETTGDVSKE